jgi:hypothetical protein
MNHKRVLFLLVLLLLISIARGGGAGIASQPAAAHLTLQEYADAAVPLLNGYAESWDRTNIMLEDPAIFTSQTLLNRMDTEVRLRASTCSRLGNLDAPPEVREADAELVAACADGRTADLNLMAGLRNGDGASLQRAVDYLYRAMDHLNRAVDLLV